MSTKKLLSKLILVIAVLICSADFAEAADDFGIRFKFKGKKLTSACRMVKDADINWYRGAIFWNNIVDREGNFDWNNLDNQVKRIVNHRIKIIFTLRSIHRLFAPGSGEIDLGYKTIWRAAPPAPEYLENYRDFIRGAVERYDGDGFSDASFITTGKRIKYWQIENEPGVKPGQGSVFWNGTAADYVDLFMVAYGVIKEADPGAKVALSGFTHKSIMYHIVHGISFPSEVLRILHEEEGDFDIFDFHVYKAYEKFSRIGNRIRSILKGYGQFDQKPIWVTETNVDKNKMDPYYTMEEYNGFVAKDIVRRYSVLLGNGIKKVFWFKLPDDNDATWNIPMEPNDFVKFRGLAENNLTPKPVYYTYKLLIEKIKGKKQKFRVPRLESEPYMWVYKFGGGNNAVYIMWYDSPLGESTEVSIPLSWEQVRITHVITEPGITEPETEIMATQNGDLQITLHDSPIFVEKIF